MSHIYSINRLIILLFASLLLQSCTALKRSSRSEHPQQKPTAQKPVQQQTAQKPAQQSPQKPIQKPYTVAGKRYEPLATHEGFEEDGLASSYGKEFHGRKTSSGEKFDMNAMTAAHKTLPMGVSVKVRHKRTGSEVVVRINDRGPFVRDRIIDLSYAAASRLGILQEGIAPVRVTALGYKNETQGDAPSYRAPASYDTGTFALQVGAFTVRSNAYRFADEIRVKHGASDVQEAVINAKQYFRVRLGRFTSLSAAQKAQEEYERKGYSGCFVVALD